MSTNDPLIIHLETSSTYCSVVLSKGDQLLAMEESDKGFDHSAMLTPFINLVTRRAGLSLGDLDAVCVSAGPGSYTGLRVGVAAAKALAYALDVPLISVDTLEAVAWDAVSRQERTASLIMPVLDARRDEVYTAFFDEMGARLTGDIFWIIAREEILPLLASGESILLSGEAAEKAHGILGDLEGLSYRASNCSAAALIGPALGKFTAGTFTDPIYFTPHYLKDPNITQSRKPLI